MQRDPNLQIDASALRLNVDREPVSLIALDEIAARHPLSTCDAAYLELAVRCQLSLATRDKALQSARVQAGVSAAVLTT